MDGLGRVKIEGRRAGGGEEGRDLLGDEAGLADAGHHHVAFASEDEVYGAHEAGAEARLERVDGAGLEGEHAPP